MEDKKNWGEEMLAQSLGKLSPRKGDDKRWGGYALPFPSIREPKMEG